MRALSSPRAILAALLLFLTSLSFAPPAEAATRRGARSAAARKQRPKKVVVLLGMPGSGKSTIAAHLAARLGTTTLSTGDFIRKERAARGLADTPENDRMIALEFAANPEEISRRTVAHINADPSPYAIVEGFRTVADLKTFRKNFPQAVVVRTVVGEQRRHARQLARGRVGEDNVAYLRDRDRSEEKRGVRAAMALADVEIRPGEDADPTKPGPSMIRALDRLTRLADQKAAAAE